MFSCRQPNKKEELNVWKHDKYEEIVSKGTGKPSQGSKSNDRTNRPSKGASSTQPPAQVAVAPAADDTNAPDPVEAYLKKKLAPAPDYSTSRPERTAYGGRSQDNRQTRGPPTHPIESAPANNRQNKNRDAPAKGNSNSHSNSNAKQGAAPAMITFSRTAPTPPGTVEKARQQTTNQASTGSAQKQQQPHAPSYRSAVETRAPTQQATARTIPATAPVFVPASAQHYQPQHQQPFVQQVHVTLQGVPAAQQTPRIEQTVRMTPITSSTGPAGPSTPTSGLKPPPGLDTSLNPAAREFQPTDEASTPSSAASNPRSDPRSAYYLPSAQVGYEYPPIVRPTGENGPYHEMARAGPPAVQQVSYRPNPSAAQGHPQGHTPQSHLMQHLQSPQHGGMHRGGPAPHIAGPAHGTPGHGDYRARRDAGGRYPASPSHSEADLYAHSQHAHMAHPSMMYGAAPGASPYNVPMNMPVYDQMVYMDPRMAQYMPDGSMWYANGPVPDAQPVTGGTVYYPLPTPGNE